MTVAEAYGVLASSTLLQLALFAGIPVLDLMVVSGLKALGRKDASQQAANLGIALGLGLLFLQALGLAYAVSVLQVDPVQSAPLVMLLGPGVLAVTGFAIEHIFHPGEQAHIRNKIRGAGLIVIVLGVLYGVMSITKIYMLVFASLWGFIAFLAVIVGVLYLAMRYIV